MRVLAVVLALAAGPALAQDATLADIRQQLTVLYGDIEALRGELSASGALSTGVAGSTPLDRLNAIEAELQRLTSKTEELEFRVNRITVDGTNRVGDLEFRLCELEPTCDIALLGDTPSLGGVDSAANIPVPAAPVAQAPDLALGEQQDFEAAQQALAAGDFQIAVDRLAAFGNTYPGSPLEVQANIALGQAQAGLGQNGEAARAYLAAFSAEPEGPFAPEALFRLGRALGDVGQIPDACVTLAEVGVRFPNSTYVAEANSARGLLGCT
ncbi:tol-pal system protein YbgF [Loktanella sp. DSM 29012]|uniref:tetratricopeptide repeat protein n=1 Tax=Loktanella sp. DSM 29012 TaxID=1881056 RepID=UPI0008C4B05E|nr:tetratricopeptide repeat protein [Loktanella sp. DSM 29012]SEP78457.1 tol-pal system protein YbgF [Loktanella sp. DSM 29012]